MNDRPSKPIASKLSRRDFLGAAALVAASAWPAAQTESPPILDFHQHTKYNGRPDQQLLAHQAYHHITKTVLLPGEGWMLSIVGDNETCAALVKQYPERFLLFACSDVAESRTPYVLRGNIRGRAGDWRIEVSRRRRLAGDAPRLQAGRGAGRASAHSFRAPDLQHRVRPL